MRGLTISTQWRSGSGHTGQRSARGTGRFGIGPRSLKSADEIWLLDRGKTPFVLRKRTEADGYCILGEAYVHGVMNGEIATPELFSWMGPVTIHQRGDANWNETSPLYFPGFRKRNHWANTWCLGRCRDLSHDTIKLPLACLDAYAVFNLVHHCSSKSIKTAQSGYLAHYNRHHASTEIHQTDITAHQRRTPTVIL